GSVKGKNDGRNRTRVSALKKRRAKVASVALKSTKLIPSSTARPSICSNTGECDASNGSRRYARPGITTRTGGGERSSWRSGPGGAFQVALPRGEGCLELLLQGVGGAADLLLGGGLEPRQRG